jgi:hypothetical protein
MRRSASRRLGVLLLVVAGLALFACVRRRPAPRPSRAEAWRRAAPATPAPMPVPGPRMDHAKHLAKGLECADCHLKGAEGETVTEPRAITYAVCAECHDEEDAPLPEEKRVKAVFFLPDGAPAWKRALTPYDPEVRWSHAPHGKLDCTECHRDLEASPRLGRALFEMDGCMRCHEKHAAPNRCDTCHHRLREDAAPASHAAGWRRAHGAAAAAGEERCEVCHKDPATCDRCHQTTRPASHDAAWRGAHGAAALARAERCEMCHVDPQGCVACHVVTPPASHGHLWKERHGQAALSVEGRAQGRCDLCHLDPNFCQRCHAVEPPRNHTHLFRTRTHGSLAAVDRAKCAACHETDFCVRCHEGTPPRSHGPLWASGPNLHCVQCHFPIAFEGACRTCHFQEPNHETAPDQPSWHTPGMNCRLCHTPAGSGAPPLRHLDNGTACETCHK